MKLDFIQEVVQRRVSDGSLKFRDPVEQGEFIMICEDVAMAALDLPRPLDLPDGSEALLGALAVAYVDAARRVLAGDMDQDLRLVLEEILRKFDI